MKFSTQANIEIAQQAWAALMSGGDSAHFGGILEKSLRALTNRTFAAPGERRAMSDQELLLCRERIDAAFGRIGRVAAQDPTSPVIGTIAEELLLDLHDLG